MDLHAEVFLVDNAPLFHWESDDTTIVKITPDENDGSNSVINAQGTGETTITITDTRNFLEKVLDVTVDPL